MNSLEPERENDNGVHNAGSVYKGTFFDGLPHGIGR